MKFWRKNFKKAFTIVELLVVGAIFAVAIGSFFGAASISFRAVSKASDKVQAAFLLEEGLEGIRHLRDLSFTHYLSSEELGYERCLAFNFNPNVGGEVYNFATSTAEVVSRWHLDETGGSSVVDVSTSTNSGTFSGTPSWVAGKFNNAASFNGASYINTALTPTQLKLTNAITLEAWVKPNAGSGVRKIIDSQHDGGFCCPGAYMAALDLDTNGLPRFSMTVVDTTWATTLTALAAVDTTNWHHIVGTYKNTGGSSGIMELYVDGKSSGVSAVGSRLPVWANFPFYIGASHTNAGQGEYFNGTIDEVVVYNRALTVTEVMDRYNGHAICKPTTLTDDNSTVFTRTVKFENICRVTATWDAVAPPGDATLFTTAGALCPGGTVDTKTKKATISVFWGLNRDSIESVEMYIADLFLN